MLIDEKITVQDEHSKCRKIIVMDCKFKNVNVTHLGSSSGRGTILAPGASSKINNMT